MLRSQSVQRPINMAKYDKAQHVILGVSKEKWNIQFMLPDTQNDQYTSFTCKLTCKEPRHDNMQTTHLAETFENKNSFS